MDNKEFDDYKEFQEYQEWKKGSAHFFERVPDTLESDAYFGVCREVV